MISKASGVNRTITRHSIYTPAATIVAAGMRAETEVPWRPAARHAVGTAHLPTAPQKIRRPARVDTWPVMEAILTVCACCHTRRMPKRKPTSPMRLVMKVFSGVSRRRLIKPMADQEIAGNTHQFPKDEHHDQVGGEDDAQHGKTKKLRAPKYLENPMSFPMYTKEKTWTSVPMNVTMSNISRLMGSFRVWISMAKDSWPTAVGSGESFSAKPMESQEFRIATSRGFFHALSGK